jgi:beta-lactamase regulating signal transducer with metallopeptidase domain
MSAIGLYIGALAVRITVVAALALLIAAWTARRSARSTVMILAATAAIILIQAVAGILPLPDSYRWSPALSRAAAQADTASQQPLVEGINASVHPGGGIHVVEAWNRIARWSESEARQPAWPHGWLVVVGIYGLGFVTISAHLLVGWLALQALKDRSQPIVDTELSDLAESLRLALGCSGSIELRQTGEPGLAATAGWRQPVIFLPPEWPSWTPVERRAVLAHELAHVRYRDYAIGLLARCCQVVYFFHPLVWLLSRQLRWQQEIAADAAAAPVAGGRGDYWKALARLALRAPARMPVGAFAWSAWSGGTFSWRIEMLRGTERGRPLSWMTHGTILGLLAGAALLASTLGIPAAPPVSAPRNEAVEPFELGYIGSEMRGFVAIRPNVLFAQPGMKEAFGFDEIRRNQEKAGIHWPAVLRPENIEQIVTDIHFSSLGTGKPGSRSLSCGLSAVYIRLNQDFDWLAFFMQLSRDNLPEGVTQALRGIQEVHQDGLTIYRLGVVPLFSPVPVHFYMPDARTIVFSSGMATKDSRNYFLSLIKEAPKARQRDWSTGARQAGQAPLVLCLDNRDRRYAKTFEKDIEAKDVKVVEAIRNFTLAVELGDGKPVHLFVEPQPAANLPDLEKALNGYAEIALQTARGAMQTSGPSANRIPTDDLELLAVTELLQSRHLHRHDGCLEWLAYSSVRVPQWYETTRRSSKADKHDRGK